MTGPVLELDRLSVAFLSRRRPAVRALTDVSLTVQPGEVVVVAGESGSGKTVLAHALLQLLPRNAEVTGAVRLEGRDLLGLGERELRRVRACSLALVPQGAATALNPVRRLRSQAASTASYRGLERTQLEQRLSRRLKRLDLDWDEVRRRYPHQLSGGMQQRVVTTLSTVGEPRVIIADEPTNGLDAHLVDATADALLKLRSGGTALVVITHDLRLARRLGGRLALLYASTLVEVRDTVEVLDNPRHPYARGLVGALPEHGAVPIPGLPPRLDALPAGCPFAPRCTERRAECDQTLPPLAAVPGGFSRCLLHAEG